MGKRTFCNWHIVFYLTVRALHLETGAMVELAKGTPHCVPHGPTWGLQPQADDSWAVLVRVAAP